MFDEDLPKKKSFEFPRNLDSMSIEDLKDYIDELQEEISRVEANIEAKQASHKAADSFFKN